MTREQRLVVSLDEIRGIQWACVCGATITMPIDQTLRVPTSCPACQEPFDFAPPGQMVLAEWLRTLKAALRVMQDQSRRATLKLDLGDPGRHRDPPGWGPA